jgi:magnesium transporter
MTESTRERSAPSDEAARTTIVVWRPTGVVETTDVGTLAELARDPEVRLWVDAVDPSPEAVRTIAAALDLHHLIAEDITERNQRAKIETFGEVVHIVMFALAHRGEVRTDELDFVLGEHMLLSVHGPEWDPRRASPLKTGIAPVLAKGTDYLLYALADHVVDGYYPVLASATDWTLQRLFVLKRELLEIRRSTSPAREIFNQLTNREVGPIAEAHVVYFRDVYDHLIRVTDELDTYRELVGGTLEMYLSIINNNLSRIMKRLTGVTVILAGIGAFAGIFGMSEAGLAVQGSEASGFWLVTAAIVGVATMAAVILRRFDWF